jgi:hypothetical protein
MAAFRFYATHTLPSYYLGRAHAAGPCGAARNPGLAGRRDDRREEHRHVLEAVDGPVHRHEQLAAHQRHAKAGGVGRRGVEQAVFGPQGRTGACRVVAA